MKLWEKGMAAEIEAEVKPKWKRFAETGDCIDIDCDHCPLKGDDMCRMSDMHRILNTCSLEDVVKAMNKEAE